MVELYWTKSREQQRIAKTVRQETDNAQKKTQWVLFFEEKTCFFF